MTAFPFICQKEVVMHPKQTPTVEGSFRIMPDDIDATRQFLSAFGRSETEFAALGVILFCQAKGTWAPFTKDELTEFFRSARAARKIFPFNSMWSEFISGTKRRFEEDGAALLFMTPDRSLSFPAEEPNVFRFHDLEPWTGLLIRLGEDGKYRVTEMFIERCHAASPKRRPPPAS